MTALVWRGQCLRMRPGKGSFRGVACSPEAKPVPSGAAGNTVDQDGVKPCKGKPFDVPNQLELEGQVIKEIPVKDAG
jgi:hypothetical protein